MDRGKKELVDIHGGCDLYPFRSLLLELIKIFLNFLYNLGSIRSCRLIDDSRTSGVTINRGVETIR